MPFHINRDLELETANLLVLCESRRALNCHLLIGHLGDYRSWNTAARMDAAAWNRKMAGRPGRET